MTRRAELFAELSRIYGELAALEGGSSQGQATPPSRQRPPRRYRPAVQASEDDVREALRDLRRRGAHG